MEYLIAASVLGLGYILQTDNLKKKSLTVKSDTLKPVPKNQIPSPENVYTSKRAFNIFQGEQKQANVLFDKSLYPQDTNVVTPGPPVPIMYNKVDYAEKRLPIEFNSYQKYDDITIDNNKPILVKEPDLPSYNKALPDSGGWSGISLTGDPINPNKFTHNNMTPFFGGAVTQNLDEFSTRGIFENFTGTQDSYQKKKEQGLLFQPQKNMSNVYGMGSLDGFLLDRYYVSNIRSNETPIEKVYVGPGLNQGFTNEPSGGFQQADTLDYVMPKTTDEIRVKTDPKISYYGRINPGAKIAKPGKIGTLYKNKPDTFYIQEPDRYFTTTGQVIAAEQRPCIVTKYTNRKSTELKTRTGSAAPTNGTVAQIRSKYKISSKVTYTPGPPRNVDGGGQWSILNMLGFDKSSDKSTTNKPVPNDYGKNSIRMRDNKRILNDTNKKQVVMNYKSPIEKSVARNKQIPKTTRKDMNIKNKRINGNFNGQTKGVIYDPNDIARRTIKETNIHNNYHGGVQNINRGSTVYDPSDIARTTIKETNIDNNYTGAMNSGVMKGVAYDPSDITRTTIKETNIDNNYQGAIQNINRGSVVYDPSDIARTTVKETNIHNNYSGAMNTGAIKGVVYDPTDVARTTIKETNIHNKRKANINSSKNGTYSKSKDKAKKTVRETTMIHNAMGVATQTRNDGHTVKGIQVPETTRANSSVSYTGDATGPELGAYDVTDVNAPSTLRQMTSDIEYFGGAGNDSVNTKPMSYEDIYNAQMKAIRSETDEGYTPGPMGPNQGVSMSDINMTTTRIGDIQNKYITERGTQSNKVYNSLPQMSQINLTQEKEIVPNEPLADRINPVIVNAFKENPYTQPLDSWA